MRSYFNFNLESSHKSTKNVNLITTRPKDWFSALTIDAMARKTLIKSSTDDSDKFREPFESIQNLHLTGGNCPKRNDFWGA